MPYAFFNLSLGSNFCDGGGHGDELYDYSEL